MRHYLLPEGGNFYKANLHTHSIYSDGARTVEEIKRENAGESTSVMAAQMFTKVCAISARALAPIYEATNGQYGFVCLQVDPREIRNTQAMIDQVHFWNRAMAKELNAALNQIAK